MFELRCKDVGFDCPGVVQGSTKEEVLQQAAAHAAAAHGTALARELATRVMALIRRQPGDGPGAAPA